MCFLSCYMQILCYASNVGYKKFQTCVIIIIPMLKEDCASEKCCAIRRFD